MKNIKRPLAFLLAFCLILSLSVTGFAMPVSADEPAVIADETTTVAEVYVSSAEELKNAMQNTGYSAYDELDVILTQEIYMTEQIAGWAHSNLVIDGNGNTLYGPEGTERQYYMFTQSSSSDLRTRNKSLTFKDINIDANQQYFLYFSGAYASCAFELDNVELSHLCGNNANAGITVVGNSSNRVSSLVLNGVKTTDCTGTLIQANYFSSDGDGILIKGSTLTTSVADSSGTSNYAIYLNSTGANLTLSESTINYTDYYTNPADSGTTLNKSIYGIYNAGWTVKIEDDSGIYGTNRNGSSAPYYLNGANTNLTLGNCTIQNTDESRATIDLRTYTGDVLDITGDVSGSPEVIMGTNTGITVGTSLNNDLYYSFNTSIDGINPLVAKGTGNPGEEGSHVLDESDLSHLLFTEDSFRTLKINEEDGCAYLYCTDIADCNVALDAADSEGTYEGENGSGPIFQRNENDGALEPDVIITMGDKTVPAENYTVEYGGTTTVPKGTDRTTILSAWATVSPAGDLTGESQKLWYYIEVSTTYELTPDNTETVLTYENGTYSTKVTYNGQALTEDKDYTVVYRIDGDSYTVTATITGAGNYIGSYEVTFDLPGKRTVTKESELNQALEQRVAYIEFGDNIDDLTGPVVVDYDVVIDGAGFTLFPDQMANDLNSAINYAILSVSSGNVVLTDLTVDGNYQARLLYVGSGADVTLTGGTVLQHGGLGIGHENQKLPRQGMTADIEEGGTLTLDDCIVRDGGVAYPAIYNMGELNIQNNAYLTNLPTGYTNTYSIDNSGTLNWTGGKFDANLAEEYTSTSCDDNGTGSGTVIQTTGVFNMSGTAELNGFLLDEETGQYTNERTKIVAGAVHVGTNGEFNLSGDAVITGFWSIGFGGDAENLPSGGGGVYNNGEFNMNGGNVINNIAEFADVTGQSTSDRYAGGGVYNAGIFNMTGGEITDNTADVGGGIYNDNGHQYGLLHNGNVNIDYDNAEFYMSGGLVDGNHLNSNVIENSGRNIGGMGPGMGERGGTIQAVGSELFVSGGSTAIISGGTIAGTTENEVARDSDENETEDTVKIPVGIAVAPSQETEVSQTRIVMAEGHNGSITITGGADIDIGTGIVLVSENNYSQSAYLNNPGDVVQNDPSTYDYDILDEPVLTTNASSWLELDGTLATALKINTITTETLTINFTNIIGGTAASVNSSLDGGSSINVNSDGDLVAVYRDRVTPDENDAQWLQAGASIFLKHESRTYETEVTVVDDDGNETTEMVETTLDADAWEICTHAARIEVDAKEASCSETGNIQYWYCPNCLKLFDDADATPAHEVTEEEVTIPKTAHTVGWTDGEPATCEEDGYTEGYICKVCGAFIGFDEETEEPAEDRIIPANGHSWIIVDEEPATATENGHTAYVTCEVCGKNFIEPEVIPAGETSPTDKTALNVAIETAEGLTEANYTPGTWKDLQDALAAAKDVADDADALQDDVNTALTDLLKAIGELEFASTADKTALSSVISQIEEMNPEDYTPESWADLDATLQGAQEVLENPDADQDAVNAAMNSLMEAIVGLVKEDGSQSGEVDKTALNVAIKAAEMYTDYSAYTPESWDKLQDALNYAKTIADEDYSATKGEVETARSDLMTAIEELVKASETDKTSLSIAITAADALDESNYTPETWKVLQDALDDAQHVLTDPTADSTDVENAVNAVMAAIDGLEKASSEEETDTSALKALVDATAAMTEKMNSSDYTADSWNALQDALTNAKNVADSSDSTPADVAAAMEALTAALNGLKPAEESGTPEPPDETKDGFVQENGEWHYYDNGTRFTGTDIKEDTKKVVDGTDGWFYIENGKINFSCNSVEQNAYGWWYVLNGKVDFSYTGVANYSNAYGWWYISGGKVDFSKTGIEPNNYGWWRVVNGQVDFSCNSVEQNDYGWWYLVGGKVQFDYTGVANYANANGWWYVSGGKVDFSKTSIEQNNYGWWRVVGGKVDFSCNSVEQNDYGWWYVVGGKVDFSYTGVANYANAYGWWYISGGKVDFSYTGRASNNYGTWNVVNGKVVF